VLTSSQTAARFLFFGLMVVAPLVAQTQIGGGACNSSYLNGTYALSISGRQVTGAGNFTGVLQANGTATFDGQSTVNITATENTIQALGTALNWSGTYSVEANCSAVVNITSGGSATLNITLYTDGKSFSITGNDATYAYTGGGIIQPAQSTGCSVGTLNGVYTFNATGFTLATNSVSGIADSTGLLQFDGQGMLVVNASTVTGPATTSASTLTGSYMISSNCTGSAKLTDSNSNPFVMSFSVYSFAATNTNFFASLAGGNFLMAGGGRTGYAPGAGTCSTSQLKGSYSLTLSGRGISGAGNFTGSYQGIGTATFDGNGNVVLSGTANTNLAQAQPFSYAGTYSLPSNCSGMLMLPSGAPNLTLVVWGSGSAFALAGSDATYVYSGGGNNSQPVACATATLSGEYTFAASGFTLSGTTQNGSQDEAGVLVFDGQGKVTANYTDTEGDATPVTGTASGTYTVMGCQASATLEDSSGKSNAWNLVIGGAYGGDVDILAASDQFVRSGSAHSAFLNPSQSIGNVASYEVSATPPGSVFVLFGQNLASGPGGAVTTTLPTSLLNTTVTVNGELAPLFYIDPLQIDAQLPWDIPGNTVASVIVTNGSSISNAAAIYVPATGTPGISTFATDRAVVINADGSVNTGTKPASVGDEVVVYFTGGGPVQASGKLTTGVPAPPGLSPVTGDNSITVGDMPANVIYMGLTPGSIGLYQANFNVPQIAQGTYPVVVTIAGQSSNKPVMTVSN
jgi:uncharacterized protein (TIGR03437 family)